MITHCEYREGVKAEICALLIKLYKYLNDGLMPNYDEDEEVFVEVDEFSKRPIYVNIEVSNIYNGNSHFEQQRLNSMVVTLDSNLFFRHGEYEQETEWAEISTDELVSIRDILQTHSNFIPEIA
jgi:hypothetical protein